MAFENHDTTRSPDARLDRIFAALASPPRRRIVELLRESGELKVTDVARVFAMSLNGVSKHIKVLERAGLVVRRTTGREHWLHVDWTALQAAYEWLHFHRHFWNARLDRLAEHLREDSVEEGNDP